MEIHFSKNVDFNHEEIKQPYMKTFYRTFLSVFSALWLFKNILILEAKASHYLHKKLKQEERRRKNMNYKIFKLLFLTCFGLVQVQAYDDFDPPTIIPKSVEGYYVYKKGMTAKIRYV